MSDRGGPTLGEFIRVKHGFAFSGEKFGVDPSRPTVVTPANFEIGGGFKEAKPKTFDGTFDSAYVLAPGDLIVSMTDLSRSGDTLGTPAFVPDSGVFLHNQRIGLIEILKPGLVDRNFLGYLLRTAGYRQHILGSATGSTVRHTSPERIASYPVSLPSFANQVAIAEVLGALDNKIAANSAVATAADELIRAQYAGISRRRSVRVSDLADVRRDQVDPTTLAGDERYVGLEHLPRRHMWLRTSGFARDVSSAKSRFSQGDILFGKLRPYFHKVVAAPGSGICSTDVLPIKPKDPDLRGFVLAALSSDQVVRIATEKSEGTRMPRSSWADLAEVEVPYPGGDAARAFSLSTERVSAAVTSLLREGRTLSRLRDTLLPQLVSGKLRVRDAEKTIEEAL